MEGSPYDFSFSGLKTAVLNLLNQARMKGETLSKEDLSASFQQAVCDLLAERFLGAAEALGWRKLAQAGFPPIPESGPAWSRNAKSEATICIFHH